MIDLHCHILPGVDDGPEGVDGAVALAQDALRDGVHTVVATPHGNVEWGFQGDESEARERVATLRAEFTRRQLELELLPGLEVALTPDVPALCTEGRLFTLNGSRYLLVEFPIQLVPSYAEATLFRLQIQKLVPVIAHPERNTQIAADPEILLQMVRRGMLAQITAGSLVGAFGAATQRVAEALLTRGLAHVIASDAHLINGRSFSLSRALQRAESLVGEESARAMVTTVPEAILQDQEVVCPEPRPAPRRTWFPFSRRKS